MAPILLLMLPAVVWSTACTHILHPAHVEPGYHIEVAVAGVRQQTTRYPETVADAQIALGYGKRFNDDVALGLQLVVPLSFPRPSDSDPYTLAGSILDLYVQVLGDPVDLGFGVVGGLAPEVYAELGHVVERDGYKYSGNLGIRVSLTTQVSPFVIVDVRIPGGLRVGLFSEYSHYVKDLPRCLEGCEDEALQSRLVLGAFVGIRL